MRVLLVSTLLLSSCCFGGGASPTPPPTSAPLEAPPGTCPDVATAILGSWSRTGFVEEYGANGSYTINGHAGTITWLRPGHALIDVPPTLHTEYDLGLTDVNELIAVDPQGVGTVYARLSPPPPIEPACYDIRPRFVGTWLSSGTPERYDADGTYQVAVHGQWSFTNNGHLHLASDEGVTNDYWFAIVSPTAAIAVSMPPLPPLGVVYTR